MLDLSRFPIHHIGIAVPELEFTSLTHGKNVNDDRIQGVQTYFEFNGLFNCYIEYFTTTGRAKNYSPGFNHICYDIGNLESLLKIISTFTSNEIAIQLTKIEKSGSKECDNVVFYFLSGIGIVEFNIHD